MAEAREREACPSYYAGGGANLTANMLKQRVAYVVYDAQFKSLKLMFIRCRCTKNIKLKVFS